MKYAILKKIFLFFACMGFLLLHQAEAVQIELTPAVTGSQARDCTIDLQDFPPVSCGNSFILSDFFAARLSCGNSKAILYDGIIEFDISGAYGLFTSGQIQATLNLTISNFSYYFYDFSCVSVVNMKDACEDGIVSTTDSYEEFLYGICPPSEAGDTITLDVTSALEHDLFADNQSDFSGFMLLYPGVAPDGGLCGGYTFYNETDAINGPKLIVSSTPTGCSTWAEVIGKYNAYVSGQALWNEVITCYNEYVSGQ
jgi:hypothetical protein